MQVTVSIFSQKNPAVRSCIRIWLLHNQVHHQCSAAQMEQQEALCKMSHSRLHYSLHRELSNLSRPFYVFLRNSSVGYYITVEETVFQLFFGQRLPAGYLQQQRGHDFRESFCMLPETASLSITSFLNCVWGSSSKYIIHKMVYVY